MEEVETKVGGFGGLEWGSLGNGLAGEVVEGEEWKWC